MSQPPNESASRHGAGPVGPAEDPAGPVEDWSPPAIFGRAVPGQPRRPTEADPMTMLAEIASDWSTAGAHEPQWSATTYGGPLRYRPPPVAAHSPAPSPTDARGSRGVLASSRTMAIASLASRVTGFLRSLALAYALGTGLVSDAYNGANSFPNSVYELLLGGVLSSVLIPLLVHAQENDEDGGQAYTQRLLSIAASMLAVATLVAVALAPYLAALFVAGGSQRTLTSTFATLLLPEIFFYGLSAMFSAVLNTRHVYGPGAWAPLANNAITLLTVAVFLALPGPGPTLVPANMTTAQVLVLGVGTTLGIVGQALVLLPSLRRVGFRWQWRFRGRPTEAGRLKEAGSLSGWVLGYVVASQVGVLVVTKVAFTLGRRYGHGVSTFTYADLLFQVPYGIIGVSLLTAIMPRMARAATRGDSLTVLEDITLGARLSALALIPITAGLMALGPVFTVVLFAHGKTSILDARLIGTSLALSAFGLLPFALVMLQLRVFYALRDGRTPALINLFMVGTKVLLVLLAQAGLHGNAAVEALNFSTSASYVVGAVIGHVLLRRRMGPLGLSALRGPLSKIVAASAAGGGLAYLAVRVAAYGFGDGRGAALTGLVAGSIIGLAVMLLIAARLGLPELSQLRARLGRGSRESPPLQ